MHNLTKIKLFRILLWCTYPVCVLFVYPLALLRKKNPSHLFFFFDRFALGGAQKIHLDILNSISNTHKQVYFTRKSLDDTLKKNFYEITHTESCDIHNGCDYLLFRLFTVHYWSFYINRHPYAHVFSSNSTFFYDMLPFLKKTHTKTELLHNFTYGKNGMEYFGLINYRFLSYRIVYDLLTYQNIKDQYKANSIPDTFLQRVLFIEPGISIEPATTKDHSLPLKILYAGRGGLQKRVWLINRIARHFLDNELPVQFHFAGNMEADLSQEVMQQSIMHGMVSNEQEMKKIYSLCHAVLLTSAYEGFPMVIKEGMERGAIPVVTALTGNKTHLIDGENALLIKEITNEDAVVQQGILCIEKLMNNQSLRQQLSSNCREYAVQHFDKTKFINQYRTLLLQ